MSSRQKFFLSFFIGFFLCSNHLASATNDYVYPHSQTPSYGNYGGTGLIQNPTARFHQAGTLSFNWNDIDPYLRGSIIAYPFSWFEASYQYADVNNALYSNIAAFSGDQTYKDKSFDMKFLILPETPITPALAIGGRDIAGTGMFSSEFMVLNKRISMLDFSFGIGWGSLKGGRRVKNPFIYLDDRYKARGVDDETLGGEFAIDNYFSGPSALFGGVEIFLPNLKGLRVKVEYDAVDYTDEGYPTVAEGVPFAFEDVTLPTSKINYGLLYPVTKNFHLKFNYVKGNTFSFGFSLYAPLGPKDPIIKKNDQRKTIQYPEVVKKVNAKKDLFLYRSALTHLKDEKLFLQAASLEESTLEVVYTQSTHISYPRATGRVASVLNDISPDNIKNFEIAMLNGNMGMHNIKIDRESFSRNKDNNHYKLAVRDIGVETFQYNPEDYKYTPDSKFPAVFYKIAPALRSQIGGPDGFYFGDARLALHSEILFAKNISLITSASYGLFDNYDDLKLASDSVLPHVRTDIVKYLKQSKKYALERMQLNMFYNPYTDWYAKFTAGYLETMFAGIGGEILYRPFNSPYAIGAELWRVGQREYNQMLKLRDYRTTTGHINLYYREPRSKVLIALKGGTFLAKDAGINFDFSRRFKSGLHIGAFFSLTDISKAEFGEGSFDKGFYFHVPVEAFFNTYSKGLASFGLRPITRDGAQSLIHSHGLFSTTDQAQRDNFTRDWDDIYD